MSVATARSRTRRGARLSQVVLLGGVALSLVACGNRLPTSEIQAAAQGGGPSYVVAESGQAAAGLPTAAAATTGTTDPTAPLAPSGSTQSAPGPSPALAAGTTSGGTTSGGTTSGGSTSGGSVKSGSTATTSEGSSSQSAVGTSGSGARKQQAGDCVKPTKSPVKLGNVSSQSGVLGAVFVGQRQALGLWVQYVNRCNGLNGHPVDVVSADDQGNPGVAVTNMQRLVEQDKVIAFIGNLSPLADEAQYNYLTKAKVPLIGGDGLYDDLIRRSPMVFPASSSFEDNTGALAKGIVAQGQKKIALYYCVEITICTIFDTNLRKQLPAAGATVVVGGTISLTQVSLSSQCAAAQRAGADHVIVGADSATVVRFAKNCAESFNYHPKFSTLSLAANVSAAQEKLLDGLIAPTGVFPFYASATPGQKLFRENVATYAPDLPVSAGVTYVWASGMLAVAASTFLGDQPTAADFLKGLYTIKSNDLDGISPKLTFTPSSRSAAHCSFGFLVRNGILDADKGGRCT